VGAGKGACSSKMLDSKAVGKMRNAEWKLRKDGVERWVKCVMRKFAYVGDRLSIVNSCEWACCTLVDS